MVFFVRRWFGKGTRYANIFTDIPATDPMNVSVLSENARVALLFGLLLFPRLCFALSHCRIVMIGVVV